MGEGSGNVSEKNGSLHFNCVNKGKSIGNILECTAYKLKVKPDPRKPCGKVCEEGAADSSNLLIGKYTSAKKADGDIKNCYGDYEKSCPKDIFGKLKTEDKGCDIAYHSLTYGNGDNGQGIAEKEINGGKGRCVKTLKKGALAVLCDYSRCEKRHKGKTENAYSRCQMLNFKKADGDICLNCAEKQDEHKGESKAEK